MTASTVHRDPPDIPVHKVKKETLEILGAPDQQDLLVPRVKKVTPVKRELLVE